MDRGEKVRENRIRRMADRQGYMLIKSRRRDPRAVGYGRFEIWDFRRNLRVAGGYDSPEALNLDEVERFLTETRTTPPAPLAGTPAQLAPPGTPGQLSLLETPTQGDGGVMTGAGKPVLGPIDLDGPDGDVFSLLDIARDALRRAGRGSEIERFAVGATGGNYEYLLRTCESWFETQFTGSGHRHRPGRERADRLRRPRRVLGYYFTGGGPDGVLFRRHAGGEWDIWLRGEWVPSAWPWPGRDNSRFKEVAAVDLERLQRQVVADPYLTLFRPPDSDHKLADFFIP